MVRLFILSLAVAALSASSAQAELFGGRLFRGMRTQRTSQVPNNYRTPYPTTTGGFSIGIGSYPAYNYPRPGEFDPYRFDRYVHDPYITGSFKAPDLAKDPYFRERHRYDSHFPGRYGRKPRR